MIYNNINSFSIKKKIEICFARACARASSLSERAQDSMRTQTLFSKINNIITEKSLGNIRNIRNIISCLEPNIESIKIWCF